MDRVEQLLKGQQGNYIFPFLWLHGEDEETLREDMKAIQNVNIQAVCVSSDSRLHTGGKLCRFSGAARISGYGQGTGDQAGGILIVLCAQAPTRG